MARIELRLPENAPGDLFVDETCIDCDTCRRMAPGTFARSEKGRSRGLSIVLCQPRGVEERRRERSWKRSCVASARA